MNGGGEGALFATVQAEVLELRRDISAVLVKLYESLGGTPEKARRLLQHKQAANGPDVFKFAQVEALRGEMLDLRRDVAIVMANILVASGQTPKQKREILVEQAKEIVFEVLAPKNSTKLPDEGGSE